MSDDLKNNTALAGPHIPQDRLEMLRALKTLENEIIAGNVVHLVTIGIAPNGGYGYESTGTGKVPATVVTGALELTKQSVLVNILRQIEAGPQRLVQAAKMPPMPPQA